MRDVTRFTVVFPTRLLAASYEEKKSIMDALQCHYPHYEFDAMEAFDGGIADDDNFSVLPVTGHLGQVDDGEEVILCRPLDPLVIPAILSAINAAETRLAMAS